MSDRSLLFTLGALLVCGVALPFVQPVRMAYELPAPTHKKVVLHGVALDMDQHAIAPEAAPVVAEAAEVLKTMNQAQVVIARGSESRGAAQCGADVVRAHLLAQGIPSDHLAAVALEAVPDDELANHPSEYCSVGLRLN